MNAAIKHSNCRNLYYLNDKHIHFYILRYFNRHSYNFIRFSNVFNFNNTFPFNDRKIRVNNVNK